MPTLSVQPVSPGHVGRIAEQYRHRLRSSYVYLSSLHGYSHSELEAMLGDAPFAQFVAADGQAEALLSLHDVNPGHGHARIQVCVRTPGIDIRPFLRDQMRRFRLHRLYSYVFRDEEAEQDLLAGMGFEQEAVFRQHVFMDGAYRDVLVYGLMGEDQ